MPLVNGSLNLYFPLDFDQFSCGHGRNYPAWMGLEGYSEWYLFIDPNECCDRFFPSSSNCPYEITPQVGYYWETYYDRLANDATDIIPFYNHSYYPDIHSGNCINGTDYPSWMVETEDYRHLYIFHEPEDCCEFWFGAPGCGIVQSEYTNATSITNQTAALLEMWYPMLHERRCVNDGATPSWMLGETFREHYLFNTREQCCGFFGFC